MKILGETRRLEIGLRHIGSARVGVTRKLDCVTLTHITVIKVRLQTAPLMSIDIGGILAYKYTSAHQYQTRRAPNEGVPR